ncbi:hypothetical protein [Halorussus caseinilyticus]|uniref:hypothetical protein n=1 Tax=Halorussus caseinilyticus TaxID=3034025 RepID=UPI0023E8C509|nr:hypothetical protein [Halorussus sp. DT72]
MSVRYLLLLVGLALLALAWVGAGSAVYLVYGVRWAGVLLAGFGVALALALVYKIVGQKSAAVES